MLLIMQQVAAARERAQAQQAMINQWAKEGNNGALLGNILSSALMRYWGNRSDIDNSNKSTPYDGADTTNQLLTGAMNEQMGATPQELAAQAIYGRPQMTNPADGAATSVEEWIKRNRTSRPQTDFEWKYNPWG